VPECPDRDKLERLADGALEGHAAAGIRVHLEQCIRCRTSYDQLREDRKFLLGLRGVLTQSVARGRSLAGAEARIDRGRFPRIQGYRILELIGRGGMGVVYKAIQENLDREVALKVLPAVIGTTSPSSVARFRHEAAASARLHHTNIVPVYDFGESPDGYFYAMEYIEGDSLNHWIAYFSQHRDALHPVGPGHAADSYRSEPVAATRASDASGPRSSILGNTRRYYRQVARWIGEVAEGLDYAHAQGIIHRDIKPSNLILAASGRLMIADFGLAKTTGEASVTLTGSLIGTVGYLSPEQAMAKRIPVDHRTDVYSLGATLYELLCFQRAFGGRQENEILAAVISKDPVPPRRLLSVVPQELETICLKTLEKSPDARYQSAHELSLDLRRYVDDLPIVARRPNPLQRGLKFIRRHKSASVAFAVLVLLGVTLNLLQLEQRRSAREKAQRINAQADQHIERGMGLHQAGHWAEAENAYHEALSLRDDDYVALGNLARLKIAVYNEQTEPDKKLLEEANDLCERALAHATDDTLRLWILKGVVLKKLGRLDEAIAAYDEAIADDSGDYLAWDNRCLAYALKGDMEQAESDCRRAAHEVESQGATNAIVWRNLAVIQRAKGNTECFNSLKESRRHDSRAFLTYCVCAYARMTLPAFIDHAESLSDAKTADNLSGGKEPIASRMLALAHLRNGNYDKSLEAARAALALGDTPPSIAHLIAAVAAARSGDVDGARRSFDDALSRFPADDAEGRTFVVTADRGLLWIDTTAFLHQLRRDAQDALATLDP